MLKELLEPIMEEIKEREIVVNSEMDKQDPSVTFVPFKKYRVLGMITFQEKSFPFVEVIEASSLGKAVMLFLEDLGSFGEWGDGEGPDWTIEKIEVML